MSQRPTTVTVLTPPGRGAVASVRVDGPLAAEIVATRFWAASGKPLTEFPFRRIVFGRWNSFTGSGEELVVCRLAEERVEVHCHGGAAAVKAIVASLVEAGALCQSSYEWASVHEPDLIAAEARLALSEVKTERTALILLDQYHGALMREIEAIARLRKNQQQAAAQERLERLLDTQSLGMHLTKPWRVAITGRPNAGKSSLMNALLGYARSIVFEQPGTTRDAVRAITAFEGWPVELVDTAGLRTTDDPVESAGVLLTEQEIEGADLVLHVHDATQPWDEVIARDSSKIVVFSKTDLDSQQAHPASGLRTSVVTGVGIAELIGEIARRLVPRPPQRGEAVLFTARQVALLRSSFSDSSDVFLRQVLRQSASESHSA
jgi:tRNA modification GTPase